MALDTCIFALNHVHTYGKESCENLVNSIKNLEKIRDTIAKIEEESNNAVDNGSESNL